MNQSWNADKYASDFSFVAGYGGDVLKLIDFSGAGTALDLGCGNGTLTKELSDKVERVIGIDASGEMVSAARESYPEINFIRADATEFVLEKPVDVVFSNAMLHWIDRDRQPDVLRCVYQALNPGGQFVFEMGGMGNNRLIHEALSRVFSEKGYGYTMPFYFPSIGEYSGLLEDAGFTVRYAILFDRPTRLKGDDGLKEWIRMFVKNPFRDVKDGDKDVIIDRAAALLRDELLREGVWYADYVRLRMKAVKE